jgi:sugar lactone lactonase YvrE
MLKRVSLRILGIACVAAFAACSSGKSSSTPPHSTPTAGPQTIYVINQTGTSVAEFPVTASGNVAPSVTIAGSNTTLANPIPLAVDGSGNIFVADNGTSAVIKFAPTATGNATPSTTITGPATELSPVYGLGIGPSSSLIVVSQATNSVAVFAAGATGNATPTQFITSTALTTPLSAAADSAGNIYVISSGSGVIQKFATGAGTNATPTTITTPGSNLSGIAIRSDGAIFVCDASQNTIYSFAAGATGTPAPVTTISGANSGINYAVGIALDSAGRVYLSNYQGGGGSGSITVYASGTTGNTPPIATITGSATLLSNPIGIAIH